MKPKIIKLYKIDLRELISIHLLGDIDMKIKEQTIKELESLGPSELMTVYEMIINLKAMHKKRESREGEPSLFEGEEGFKAMQRVVR